MSTLWYSHSAGHRHLPPEGHPERAARLVAVGQALQPLGLQRAEAPLAQDADLLLCHPQRHLDRIRAALPQDGEVALDGDTWLSPGSLEAARAAAGGGIAAVDAVLAGQATNAFIGCRPPGHHAEAGTAMGFCLFGSVAIAAKHALERRGLSRVAVVDFDVHHGNGTQDLLWDDPRCLFISSHQWPLYPGTGAPQERGAHDNVLNLPLRPGTDGAAMRAVYEREALPRLEAFRPDLILVSAGFDAHSDDPLGGLDWDAADFGWLTNRICDIADAACDGRVVSTLEGGYDLRALAASVAAHVGRLKDRGG